MLYLDSGNNLLTTGYRGESRIDRIAADLSPHIANRRC